MKTALLDPTWNLESIFPGGSDSEELKKALQQLRKDVAALSVLASKKESLVEAIQAAQNVSALLKEVRAYMNCLGAQNVNDRKAPQLSAQAMDLHAGYSTAFLDIEHHLIALSEKDFHALLQHPKLLPIAYPLSERRRRAKEKMSLPQEALLNELAVDGYHGWSQLYDTLVGEIKISYEFEGEKHSISAGQAYNRLTSGNRSLREVVFKGWVTAWEQQKELFAQTLNHLAGFRLKVYQKRGWDSILKEPLDVNRMSKKTLDTMWQTINANRTPFLEYLKEKAKKLGVPKLSWHDITAPVGNAEATIPYDEGAAFIVEHFGRFSPKLATFAQKTFDRRWNEVEDRSGKQAGGFCTGFPVSKQSRIFMTYSGTSENLATLAHELGHAYHNEITHPLPMLAQHYPMSLAETASIFAEQIISDAALKQAKTEQEKTALLDHRAQRSVLFFMNIQARFVFEQAFYEERHKGQVSAERLCELMEGAQKEMFGDLLEEYHSTFWASKLHFYATSVPFYNFPYTFGYLFSLGLYERALNDLEAFWPKYDALLEDSGRMSVEDLAKKHLNVDLNTPDFWQGAINIAIKDVQQFISNSRNYSDLM